jgi:F-type H+-transporting ATPase subunit epsilon
MMAIKLQIVTPRGIAFKGEVDSVQAPGSQGEFGVLPGHIAFLTTLKAGNMNVFDKDGVRRYSIGAGFAEAGPDRVVVLTESCEDAAPK